MEAFDMKKGWTTCLLLLCGAITLLAQQNPPANPYPSEADRTAGAGVFRKQCARCHGFDGSGGEGPDLTRGEFRHGSTDSELFQTISLGVPNTEMPHFTLPEKPIWQVITFVRSLTRPPVNPPGDLVSGERLYREKANCTQCHMVGGAGGRLGPDLSDIGWRRSPEHLRSSILRPNEDIDRKYWSVQIIDGSGQSISGIRLNEDSYSIQIMDMRENLLSLWKSDLKEIKQVKRSWMPSFEQAFSPSELEDLVAYLYSLRRKAGSR